MNEKAVWTIDASDMTALNSFSALCGSSLTMPEATSLNVSGSHRPAVFICAAPERPGPPERSNRSGDRSGTSFGEGIARELATAERLS